MGYNLKLSQTNKSAPSSFGQYRPRVLIVDDSSVVRATLAEMIDSFCNVETIEADTGSAALDVLCSSWVDLILLDKHMPNKDGMQVLQMLPGIYRDDLTERPSVLMMSGDSEADDIEKAKTFGVAGWIVKPANTIQIVTAVSTTLREKLGHDVLKL